MINQINTTSLKLAWLPGMLHPLQHSLTLIVKGCFDLKQDERATFADDPDLGGISGDSFVNDNPEASLLYANDLIVYKPKADLTLSGSAYPQPGQAGCLVTFAVGNWSKSLAIFNDRFWIAGNASIPEPFGAENPALPLTYENAFGGSRDGANPVGKGESKITNSQGEQVHPLPNIEHANSFLSSPSQESKPAGFGPLKDNWADKTPVKGTYGGKWLKENFPYFPVDFDWGYFNTAPKDQQLDYLKGDEPLYFENLHPKASQYHCELPAIRPRLFLNGMLNEQSFFKEVTLRIDSLNIAMNTCQANILWRGLVEVMSDEFDEIQDACLFIEDMNSPILSGEHYFEEFKVSVSKEDPGFIIEEFEDAKGNDIELATEEISSQSSDAVYEKINEEAIKNLKSLFTDLKSQMQKANVPDIIIDMIGPSMDPNAFQKMITETFNLDLSESKNIITNAQQKMKLLLKEQGLDPTIFDTPTLPKVEAGLTNSDFIPDNAPAISVDELISQNDFENAELNGLDFSDKDLTNKNFKLANLADTNFANANLTGADFTDADLSNAILTNVIAKNAIFDGAILENIDATNADFTGASAIYAHFYQAKMVKANLSEVNLSNSDLSNATIVNSQIEKAILDGATVENTDFSHSQFIGTSAVQTNFSNSTFLECHFEDSVLKEALFANARLTLASFVKCDLTSAVLEGVDAESIKFDQSNLVSLKAGENSNFSNAEFIEGTAVGIIFSGSMLQKSTFEGIVLDNADFSSTNLDGATLSKCSIQKSDFTKASAISSNLSKSNLFQACFEKANLSHAILSNSNLYGAEFFNANISHTNLNGANIKQTKIALGMVGQS